MASLEKFLQKGELGPLRLGMGEADVVAALGPPQDESTARHPRLLKYGGLQVAFARETAAARGMLAHIGIYFGPHAEPLPEPVRPKDFQGTAATTINDVREFLAHVGLQARAEVEDEDLLCLTLSSGARIAFVAHKLRSIHFAMPASTPAKKQVSVAIPEAAWSELKGLARQAQRSVGDLCAEWIVQRIHDLQREKIDSLGQHSS